MSQKLTITRTNGNVPRKLAGEDHISGLVFYSNTLPSGFSANDRIKPISSIESAEALGITSDADAWNTKVLHYILSSIFNINPGISLYVSIQAPVANNPTFSEIKALQNYAGGRLRQIGVWDGTTAFSAANLLALKAIRTALEQQDKPALILYAPKVANIADLPADVAGTAPGVAVVIGQDGSGVAATLMASGGNGKPSVTALGDLLGVVSLASVHESIAWVEKFQTGISVPAFSDGKLFRDQDSALIEQLDTARYLFLVTYDGYAGSYFNDSHVMDTAISDYSQIENVRTMDKACRGVRAYTLPKLGRPLKVDASTGQLETHVIEDLQTTANKALEDMEKAGELSGYKVEIDPDQNVLSSSTVEMVIKQVGVGVMRRLNIKIGYTLSV